MKKTTIFLIGLCCLFATAVHARPDAGRILFSGRVHDGDKGIPGVAVTDGTDITHTDAKGRYSLWSDTAAAEFVYISLPAGYEVPLEDGAPRFYVPVKGKSKTKQTVDFALRKSAADDTRHKIVVWADPQVYHAEELLPAAEAAEDVGETVSRSETPVYGIVCGDITGDHPEYYPAVKKMLAGTGIPFFFAPGNHDLTYDVRSNERAKSTYGKTFGPDYYSFNRGKVHYAVLDDVFYVGRSYWYIGYLPERQLAWLEKDLASVAPGSTVVVVLHIPSSTRETKPGEPMHETLQNRRHLHELLRPYNAHIFSGHMHYNDNFAAADGLYEHVHAAVCGEFWQTPQCSDGTPRGYAVYEMNGSEITWYYKATGHDRAFQFRAYRPGENPEKPNAVTANVWNYDPAWKVLWYENGEARGEMTRYRGHDPHATDYINRNRERFRYSWITPGETEHLFFAEPSSPDVSIKIEVIDRFGNRYTKELP